MSALDNLPEEVRARIRAERDEMLARIMTGEDAPSKPAPPKRKRKPPGSGTPRPRGRKYDIEEIKALSDEGHNGSEIARRIGADRQTVSRYLQILGRAPGKPGAPRKSECVNGHDMSVHGRDRSTGDGRYCSACHKVRGQAAYQERKKARGNQDG